MLREARIVMPQTNDPVSPAAHRMLAEQLARTFGGFTAYVGHGAWIDKHDRFVDDEVCIYDIAIDSDRDQPSDLIAQFAIEAGTALHQKSVYVRYPNGEVEIIDLTKERATTVKSKALLNALLDRDASHDDNLDDAFATAMADAVAHGLGVVRQAPDGRFERVSPSDLGTDRPMPNQTWNTRDGQVALVERTTTSIDGGGLYCKIIAGEMAGFCYATSHDGNVFGAHRHSRYDLIDRVN